MPRTRKENYSALLLFSLSLLPRGSSTGSALSIHQLHYYSLSPFHGNLRKACRPLIGSFPTTSFTKGRWELKKNKKKPGCNELMISPPFNKLGLEIFPPFLLYQKLHHESESTLFALSFKKL